MAWDFAEINCFAQAAGDYATSITGIARTIGDLPATQVGGISNIDAASNNYSVSPVCLSTDPPYYDNIGYADLSDFFYVWLRRSLGTPPKVNQTEDPNSRGIWPHLFRRLTVPKADELVATPYRHGGKAEAEAFFMTGMGQALSAMRKAAVEDVPLAIYYAFKQSEIASEGITSAGWASFLQAVINAGLAVDGTWPVRTEREARTIGHDANALASSIVLVCRKRTSDAGTITRADFIRLLRRELPGAIDAIRKAGVGPVDMQQSVIGPGMGVFSRHARVLEDDDSPMSVKTALALINRVWGEIENEADADHDPETQVALAWFASYGFEARPSGDLITMANAKNISVDGLFRSGVFTDLKGRAALTPRTALDASWSPATDKTPTVWECVQHTARTLNAAEGGGEAAARLVAQMGPRSPQALALAHRLFQIATDKGWSAEALVFSELAESWTRLEDLASRSDTRVAAPAQGTLF